MISLKNINIICGHYGVGKTNIVLNLALDAASKGEKITVVDLDVINPYFRSGDYADLLCKNGVELIAPNFVSTNLDLPSLPAEIYSVFSKTDRKVIIDLGGDDAGAFAVGRFSQKIKSSDFQVFYVVNRFRALTQTPEEAVQILKEIETASRLKAHYIINNSHLGRYTSEREILEGYEFSKNVCSLSKLPLAVTTCAEELYKGLSDRILNLYPIRILVKPPF